MAKDAYIFLVDSALDPAVCHAVARCRSATLALTTMCVAITGFWGRPQGKLPADRIQQRLAAQLSALADAGHDAGPQFPPARDEPPHIRWL